MAEDRIEADQWQKQEHDAVFKSLDAALQYVDFPATKSRIAREAGGAPVSENSDLPLLKYIEALPDRRYRDSGEVKATLDERWQHLLDYRDANYEAADRRGEGGSA